MRRSKGSGNVVSIGCAAIAFIFFATSVGFFSFFGDNGINKPTGQGSTAFGGGDCVSPTLPNISDKKKFAEGIDDYIKTLQPRSPLNGMGNLFVDSGVGSGVNPAFIVALAQKESQFGTAGWAAENANNPFGRTASSSQPQKTSPTGRAWYSFSSFQEAIKEHGPYIKRVYLDKNAKTVEAIMERYAPRAENDTDKYISQVKQWMDKITTLAGTGVDCGGGQGAAAVAGGKYLNVPGVKQATSGDCGQASVLMVILYYVPSFTDNTYYNRATQSTRDNVGCVSDFYVNQKTGHKDWDKVTSRTADLEDVKKSLAAGDPVVIYTSPGSIYPGKHIFVIVGYDPADDTFYVNNPFVRGVHVHTKTPSGKRMTSAHLKNHFGDSTYGHTFIIRSRHYK